MPLGSFRLNTIGKSGTSIGWLMYNTGARASNITPGGFDVDASGNIYILDMYSSKLAKLDSTGAIQWQKYVSSPVATTSKGDGQLLALNYNDTYLICALQESSTSISLCNFNASTGALNAKAIISVASGSSIYLGNIDVGTGTSGTSNQAYFAVGMTVGGVNRMCLLHSASFSNTMPAPTVYHHLASGATSMYDCRIAYRFNGATTRYLVAYQNYITQYTGTTGLTLGTTRSFTGGFDSICWDSTGANGFIMKDNIIQKFSNAWTKAWEKTHTVSSVGGSHYYNQGMATDSSDNVYACYWNSTAGKIIIYKLNSSGALQWTKSITPTGHTADSPDAMTMKIVSTDLYLAFKYGNIDAGGMAILKIPTDGTGTKTFGNSFVLANETGSVADSTNFTLTANTPVTTTVTKGTTGSAFTLSNATLPTYTQSNI